VGSWVREAALLTGRQLLWLSVTTSAATDAAAVSHFCACIGSPCLRHCGHGASIGGVLGPWGAIGSAAAEGSRR
jgi:hypothetical protein